MSDISRPFYLSSPPRRIRAFCSHTEVITHRTEHQSPHSFMYLRSRTHARAHIVAITRALRRISAPSIPPRRRVGLPCAGHDSSSTPTHPSNPHEIRRRRIARAAHSTSSREAIDRSIMLARTSVPTRTVATFERYARDDDECAVLADARREERGETRDARRMMMRANGGMADP